MFKDINRHVTSFDVIANALYPKVFMDFHQGVEQYGNISVLDTPTFLYGIHLGEGVEIEIEKGKTLVVKLV
jgi:pyruvate carboxylase